LTLRHKDGSNSKNGHSEYVEGDSQNLRLNLAIQQQMTIESAMDLAPLVSIETQVYKTFMTI